MSSSGRVRFQPGGEGLPRPAGEISTWEGSVRRVYGAMCRDKRRARAAKARTGLAAWLKGMTDMSQT